MTSQLEQLMEYAQSDGRVCPMPTYWNELWNMLPERKQKSSGEWEPPLPLILAAWWEVPALSKILRLREHIEYANLHGKLDVIDSYLHKLKPDQWAYGDGVTDWESYKLKKGL